MDDDIFSTVDLHIKEDPTNSRSAQVIGLATKKRYSALLAIDIDSPKPMSSRVYLKPDEVRKFRRILGAWLMAQGEAME